VANPLPRYLWQAFVLRPRGMFVPPNFALIGVFGLLGVLNPGFLLLGAGAELAYLLAVVSNPRFRAAVDRQEAADPEADRAVIKRVAGLSAEARRRYTDLAERCQSVLDVARADDHPETIAHRAEVLGSLLGLALAMLERKDTLQSLLGEGEDFGEKLAELDRRLEGDLSADLRRSLEAQREIVSERAQGRRAASERVEAIDSELARIEQQAELLREQTVLDEDPARVGERIDALTGTLRSTRDWLKEQRKLDGLADTAEPVVPRLVARRRAERN
jgi:hypothetical protein